MDVAPIVAARAPGLRFAVLGRGPIAERAIQPLTDEAARHLSAHPRTSDALRGVLHVAQSVAGGAERSAQVRFDGLSLARTRAEYEDNHFAALLEHDPIRDFLQFAGKEDTAAQIRNVGASSQKVARTSSANVVGARMSFGHETSAVLLDPGRASPSAGADLVFTTRHEAIHLVDPGKGGLAPLAAMRFREAFAEARSRDLTTQLEARAALGLDDPVSDAALQRRLAMRAYRELEGVLDSVVTASRRDPDGFENQAALARGVDAYVDDLVTRLAAVNGSSRADAHELIDGVFTEARTPGGR